MTSRPEYVATAHQVSWLMLSLTNRTEPSSIPTFTPPEWYELAVRLQMYLLAPASVKKHDLAFGVMVWL